MSETSDATRERFLNMSPTQRQLMTLMIVGKQMQDEAALEAAFLQIADAPLEDWATRGLGTSMWGWHVAEQLAGQVPALMAEHDVRPQVAVARLIADALRLGIEIGARLPEDRLRR